MKIVMNNKRVTTIAALLIVLVAVVSPWVWIYRNSENANAERKRSLEQSVLDSSFQIAKGQENVLKVARLEPNELFISYWKDDSSMHVYLFLDGKWFELAKSPINK